MKRLRLQVKIESLLARMRLNFFAAMFFTKVRMRIQVWGGSQEEEVAQPRQNMGTWCPTCPKLNSPPSWMVRICSG